MRNEASEKLAQAGLQVEAALAQALKEKSGPEVRKRLQHLWSQCPVISTDAVTALRAIEVLHHQGTKTALSVVNQLASGDPAHAVTQAARLAQASWR